MNMWLGLFPNAMLTFLEVISQNAVGIMTQDTTKVSFCRNGYGNQFHLLVVTPFSFHFLLFTCYSFSETPVRFLPCFSASLSIVIIAGSLPVLSQFNLNVPRKSSGYLPLSEP